MFCNHQGNSVKTDFRALPWTSRWRGFGMYTDQKASMKIVNTPLDLEFRPMAWRWGVESKRRGEGRESEGEEIAKKEEN